MLISPIDRVDEILEAAELSPFEVTLRELSEAAGGAIPAADVADEDVRALLEDIGPSPEVAAAILERGNAVVSAVGSYAAGRYDELMKGFSRQLGSMKDLGKLAELEVAVRKVRAEMVKMRDDSAFKTALAAGAKQFGLNAAFGAAIGTLFNPAQMTMIFKELGRSVVSLIRSLQFRFGMRMVAASAKGTANAAKFAGGVAAADALTGASIAVATANLKIIFGYLFGLAAVVGTLVFLIVVMLTVAMQQAGSLEPAIAKTDEILAAIADRREQLSKAA